MGSRTEYTPETLWEWLKSSLPEGLSSDSIEVAPVTSEIGFMSAQFRATVTTRNEAGEKKIRLFIKTMPPDDLHKGVVATTFCDVTEIETYRILFRELAAFESGIRPSGPSIIREIVPTLYAGEYNKDPLDRSFAMATEDLGPAFQMMDFEAGLTPKQALNAVKKLAKFHALCYAFVKKNDINLDEEKFNFISRFTENIAKDAKLIEHVNDSMDWILRDLDECETRRHLVGPARRCKSDHGERFRRAVKECPGAKGFLIHGDLWSNNILFDENDDCRILDWQFTDVGSIFLDLGCLAFYSMSPEETERHMGSLIGEYYSSFVATCRENGLKDSDIPWSEEMFVSLAREWGHYTAFLWGVVTYYLVKTYPSFRERFQWNLNMAVAHAPHFFS